MVALLRALELIPRIRRQRFARHFMVFCNYRAFSHKVSVTLCVCPSWVQHSLLLLPISSHLTAAYSCYDYLTRLLRMGSSSRAYSIVSCLFSPLIQFNQNRRGVHDIGYVIWGCTQWKLCAHQRSLTIVLSGMFSQLVHDYALTMQQISRN